ncbi:MAG: hypothetical protein U0670_06155 [Anaerolineae bacterium]
MKSSASSTRLIGLFVFLFSVYMVVYSARIETGDTRLLFDGVSSFVDHGDFLVDLSAYTRFPVVFDATNPLPLNTVESEPLQMIAAAPLYALAKLIPGFGLVHTVWLFNSIVTALTACLLYRYALELRWNERTALVGALLFGVGTVWFPYTRTFFREPLSGFWLLTAALSLEKLRHSGYRALVWWGAAALSVMAMLLTKASMQLALPALIVIAVPPISAIKRRHILAVLLIIFAIAALIVLLSVLAVGGERYNMLSRLLNTDYTYFGTALMAYLVSPGGSFWGTSPVLLLAFPGMLLLLRRRESRYPLALTVGLLGLAVGYAYTSTVHWFGGLSLPPRFLVPVIPLWMIAVLPALDRMRTQRITLLKIAAVFIVLYALWVQINLASYELGTYPSHLPPEAHGLLEWSGGLYNPLYFRWVMLPALWGRIPFDFAWDALDLPVWPIGFVLLAIVSLVLLFRARIRWRVMLIPAALLLIGVALGLQTLYRLDVRFGALDQDALQAIQTLRDETHSGDIVLLSNPRYEDFFHNYGKWGDDARLITLPLQPGERPSPEQPALVESDNPAALLNSYTIPFLHNLAVTHDRLWVLVDGSPDIPWSVRPVERYFSAFYYPVRAVQVGDFVRLVEYATTPAPDPFGYVGAQTTTDLRFGPSIRLAGFTLPIGSSFHAGDALPISLYWVTESPLDVRYTAAVYLRDADGAPIAQHDYPPGGGFAETDAWLPNVPVWDHRALRLPADLAPGSYQLWLKVYSFAPDGTVIDLPVSGTSVLDNAIGVLPVTITVGQ